MKILITGMTPTQAGRPGRYQWLTVPALFAEALRAGGDTVEHREYVPGEDLRSYDAILIGLVPVSSIAARHVYGTLDLIARCYGGAVQNFRFYVDDWQFDKIIGAAKNKHKQGGANLFTTIKGRTNREWAETPHGRAQVALGCEILATAIWPQTISVAYPWGDTSKLPELPAEQMIYIDPSALCWDKYQENVVPPADRKRQWILGTLANHDKWLATQNFHWPVHLIGPPSTGALVPRKEPELIQIVGMNTGALTPPYRALSGTGWWRSRFLYTARVGTVNFMDPADAELIGPATAWAANNLAALESLPPDRLADLARVQLDELRAVTWSREQLLSEMAAAVGGIQGFSMFEELARPEISTVGTVLDRMTEEQRLQCDAERIAAANSHLTTDLIRPGERQGVSLNQLIIDGKEAGLLQEIRRPDTQRDVTREFDTTSLRESKHGERVHRDYAAHFFRWGWATRLIRPEDTVLDVGCGPDLPLVKVLAMGGRYVPRRYVGVDLNKLKPSAGWAELHGETNFIDWSRYDDDGVDRFEAFSKVVCFEVLEHMTREHGVALLSTMYRALQPGGTLLLSTPVFNGKAAANHVHEWGIDELQMEIEAVGFVVEQRYGTFASYPDIKRIASARDMAVMEELRTYYSDEVTACFLAPLYPDQSRNNVWLCRKQEESQE